MLRDYFNIIRKALSENRIKTGDTYYEAHHIVPECFKKFGKKSTTVLLTAEEHYKVHKILTECFKDHPLYAHKVYWAFHRMSYDGSKTLTAKEYKETRELLMPLWKRKKSEEHKYRIGIKHKGTKWVICPKTNEIKQIKLEELDLYLSKGWINSNKSVGQKRSEETKRKQSERAKNRSKESYKNIGSLGSVICENIETGDIVEAGSANELSYKIGVHYSVLHDVLNRGVKKTPSSKYYSFLQTHKIYYK